VRDNFSQLAFSNRSSHTRFELFFLRSKEDRNKTGLHRFKPNSRIFFMRRTVAPLLPASATGQNESTSRSQTKMSLWSLIFHYTVIPKVSFIWWSNNFSFKKFGSLNSTFVSARSINLTVQQSLLLLCSKTKFFVWNLPKTPQLQFLRRSSQPNYPPTTVPAVKAMIKSKNNFSEWSRNL